MGRFLTNLEDIKSSYNITQIFSFLLHKQLYYINSLMKYLIPPDIQNAKLDLFLIELLILKIMLIKIVLYQKHLISTISLLILLQ